MEEERQLLYQPNATTRPLLLAQIQDALKNRQHVEIHGSTVFIKKLLDELITFERGKAVVTSKHEEDYTIQICQNIAFPTSDKMTIENVMRQVLQEFGWPPTGNLGFVQFYFGKLLKELKHDRILPVFLFEHPEVLRQKAFQLLEILSEYTIDRKQVGIPSIICISERHPQSYSRLTGSSFRVYLVGDLTHGEVRGLVEEICPGMSEKFDDGVINDLLEFPNVPSIKAKAKELVTYMHRLGVDVIDYDLVEQWKKDRDKAHNAKAHAR